ncbi:MAG TPA: hypothetical protein VHG08_03165 [Longimicrobium sp.]|nr:hypothetical protein [Longimicrobium sp.]
MRTIRSAFRAVLACVSAAVLASCSDPVGPDIERQSRPFYYYEGQRIFLNVDPTRLTVVPVAQGDTNRVRQVLAEVGLTPQLMQPLWMENHWFVHLPAGTSAARAEAAARRLRLNEGVRFASAAYRVGDDCPLFLVNRLVVAFKPGTDEERIQRLNTALGMRNELFTTFGTRLYEYPAQMEHTPLELAAHYHRQRIVEWAEADAINGCLRNDR